MPNSEIKKKFETALIDALRSTKKEVGLRFSNRVQRNAHETVERDHQPVQHRELQYRHRLAESRAGDKANNGIGEYDEKYHYGNHESGNGSNRLFVQVTR